MVEVILVMAAELSKSEHCGERCAAPTCSSSPLLIIGDGRRHVPQPHKEEAANIDTHFHSGRDRKQVNTVIKGVLFLTEEVLKPAFLVPGFLGVHLSRVFTCLEWKGIVPSGSQGRCTA